MDIVLNGFDSLENFITGYAIDETNKNIYVFGVKLIGDSMVIPIKKKKLIGKKYSKYIELLKGIEKKYEREKLSLMF